LAGNFAGIYVGVGVEPFFSEWMSLAVVWEFGPVLEGQTGRMIHMR
jgi:hypothetical protein